MQSIKNVLFDIDGTMTDSAPGIIQAYQTVATNLKIQAPPVEIIRDFIGRPLRSSLATYVPDGKVEEAVQHYFHCYDHMRVGLMQNGVYAGIKEALDQLKHSGKQLFVVTAKLLDFTLPILNLYELESFFKAVYAPESRAATEIGDQIRVAMETEKLDPAKTVMVGDRCYDKYGARENNIPFIGVSWGYGSRKELLEAGADHIVDTPTELAKLLIV